MSTPQKNERIDSTLIIGAGPAGLTAAVTLAEAGIQCSVLEASDQVGGIARTETYKGYRFDIGGHRFFTKVKEVERLWHRLMGPDFIRVPRMSRIFYRGKYYDYPLNLVNTLKNLGVVESVRIGASYVRWHIKPYAREDNLEQWVTNRFGKRLFERFFKTYTEKVWGIPCTSIQADWAAQRIKNLSLIKAVANAITGKNDTTSLIEEFDYPRLGPGMMWERFREHTEALGSSVSMETRVNRVHLEGNRVKAVTYCKRDAEPVTTEVTNVINTMPLGELVRCMEPAAPQHVLDSANALEYRDFLIVVLIVDEADPFPDNWIYIHSPEVQVGRIQNFRSWSKEMVPHADRASIGMEYFCHEGDGLWDSDDSLLIDQATRELQHLDLVMADRVVDGVVIRQPKAYPVYDEHYRKHVDVLSAYIDSIENLQTVGRNGMHRYNNQDHSMLTAMLAARNIMGEQHDLWNVNVERSYHETFTTAEAESGTSPLPKTRSPTGLSKTCREKARVLEF